MADSQSTGIVYAITKYPKQVAALRAYHLGKKRDATWCANIRAGKVKARAKRRLAQGLPFDA